MNLRPSKKTAVAAARVVLRSIRDSSDGFPPLKSVAAAMMVVWDMNEKVKSNRKDWRRLACRAMEIVGDVWQQTKDCDHAVPD